MLHRVGFAALAILWALPLAAQTSAAVPTRVQISFTDPAYIGMPIWVMVNTPQPHRIHYPVSTAPSDFGCSTIEVQRDGILLVPEVHPNPAGSAEPACGWVSAPDSPESRLPLHIQYRITTPGLYMVRYTRHELRLENGRPVRPVVEQSVWTPLEVRTPPAGAAQEWESSLLGKMPTSPGILVGDALPSLLAKRDREVFAAMLEATYNRDEVVSLYASNTVPMFAPTMVREEMLNTIPHCGLNEALAYAFTSYGNILRPIAERVAEACLPYLRSPDPAQVASAIHMAHVLKNPYYRLSSAVVRRLDAGAEQAVDVVIAQKNEKAASWLAQYLAVSKLASAHELLWKLANNVGSEQVLICIAWLHNPADLPRLAAIVEQYDPADAHGYKNSGVVNDLRAAYGNAARPYFQDILDKSRQIWVRVAAAKELTLMGDSAGYRFFIDMLEQQAHPFYHDEMVRWLQGAFPVIQNADDAHILAFLKSR